MKKQQKRFYHEGDGIIREIITTHSTPRKDKIKRIKKNLKKKIEIVFLFILTCCYGYMSLYFLSKQNYSSFSFLLLTTLIFFGLIIVKLKEKNESKSL